MIEEQGGAMRARHVEAYIRLEAASCEKMVRRGLSTALWHDQQDEDCGIVAVRNISQFHMLISYSSLSPESSGYGEGEVLLPLVRAATNPNYHKPYFRCPTCDKRSGQLVLAHEEWACRQCQELCYRSQYLGPGFRQQLRYDELIRLLRPVQGQPTRPRYMRAERFAALEAEYAALRAARRNAPRQMPERSLRLMLTRTWVPST
ncbi:MAG: hypothetical protein V4647_10175 [Pseudomonadota bacterium]